MRLQPQVKKDFLYVSVWVSVLTAVMWGVFALLHFTVLKKVPLDWTVFLGGLCGAAVAIGNFYYLAISVQKTASKEGASAELAFRRGYTARMLLHGLWVVLAVKLSCFQWAASILPLLFPRVAILARRKALSHGKEASDSL